VKHLILGTYIVLFATGFLGVASLALYRLRTKENIVSWLIAFQVIFLVGLGIVATYFYIENIIAVIGGKSKSIELFFGILSTVLNVAIYVIAFYLGRELCVGDASRSILAKFLFWLPLAVIVDSAISLIGFVGNTLGLEFAFFESIPWRMLGYALTMATIFVFGLALSKASSKKRYSRFKRLFRGYSICAFAFAPLGFAELFLNSALEQFKPLSLDFLFFLGWNVVSITSLFPSAKQEERSLQGSVWDREDPLSSMPGMTSREIEIAELIAEGNSNKMIASILKISEATVRTHIYNLYKKAGVNSRVELLNRLRGH
jgi:DNA-binding CsgD family transcriptional regulator